jgi:hypothetical protein
VDAPPWVTLELARQENGPLLLHLVNFKPKETIRKIKALVRPPAEFRIKEAVLVVPEDHTEIKLDLVADQGGVSMVIPSMRVYALVILRSEKA